jgi:SAM-dependent methyltransferase
MNEWLAQNLVCPRDHEALTLSGDFLHCSQHRYPVVEGIPVMLLEEQEQTLGVARFSLEASKNGRHGSAKPKYYIETLGISDEEKAALLEDAKNPAGVDPVVKFLVGATCGLLYDSLTGNIQTYPIPELRLPKADGQMFLDIGCNWGRWCVAAARRGYSPVGIDPSLEAVLAARRVSAELGNEAMFVVADARYLPFAKQSFDVVFSYSVLQHFSQPNVRKTLAEIARVLKSGGTSLIQMANLFGLRSQYHVAKRRWRPASNFEVRYWRPSEMQQTFAQLIGDSELSVDGYFGLGVQASDVGLLPRKYQLVVKASESLRKLSLSLPWLSRFADSLYVRSVSQ